MKGKEVVFKKLLWAAIGLLALFILIFHQTVYGLFRQKLTWKEDAFVGKPLAELKETLAAEGRYLQPADRSTYYFMTKRDLSPNQELVSFVKGKQYSWFFVGTAVNVAYVVVDGEHRGQVVEILHGRSVDSL
ncbi:MAG TPA: hypothetical protein VN673_19135 [Clostridia bacterium]|nr:hypothetical protein [Clostridia bacterium]